MLVHQILQISHGSDVSLLYVAETFYPQHVKNTHPDIIETMPITNIVQQKEIVFGNPKCKFLSFSKGFGGSNIDCINH